MERQREAFLMVLSDFHFIPTMNWRRHSQSLRSPFQTANTGGIYMTALRDLIMRSTSSPDLTGPAYQAIEGQERGDAFVNTHDLRLVGNISDISRAGLYGDHQERVTVSVEGAEPLYAELRLPNHARWVLGQKVLVVIIPASAEGIYD
jgi:hypothetical protein